MMKSLLIIIILLITLSIAALLILGIISKSNKAPGLVNDRLSACPTTPNCVCSEHKDDRAHYIEAIVIAAQYHSVDALALMKIIIQTLGGTIESEQTNYLAATFSSTVFRFVDDVEIRVDSATNLIHIRSAARVGRSDMGVNKQRAQLLKRLFEKQITR